MLDEAIEFEKREAVEYLRAHPGGLTEGFETRAVNPPISVWAVPLAACAILAISLVFIALGPSFESSDSLGIEAEKVHDALALFRVDIVQTEIDPPCTVAECRTESDRDWQIQAAIYRLRRPVVGNEEIEGLILRSLGGKMSVPSVSTALPPDVIESLGQRIREARVERALVRWRTSPDGT